MRNRDKGIPSSDKAKQESISTNFPKEKPIFWGPGQETKYPTTYNKPVGWHENEVLHIPRVARFIIGGQVSKRRMFPIGYFNMCNSVYHFKNGNFVLGYNDPYYTYMSAFVATDELPAGSNLSANACLTRFRTASAIDKANGLLTGTPLLSNAFCGVTITTRPNYSTGDPITVGYMAVNSGTSPIGPPTLFVDPITGPFPFGSDDTVQWGYSTIVGPNPFISGKFTAWAWIYHQINEDGTQYGCLGLFRAATLNVWDSAKLDPGTASQESSLSNRQYIPDLVIP